MASEGTKSMAFFLLFLNLVLYAIVLAIAGWILNFSIEHTPHTVNELKLPVHMFPMHFPLGNMATGFFVISSLVAGVFGVASCMVGINNIVEWNPSNLLSASAFNAISWGLTFLAMGLACKEIEIGKRGYTLRTLEALTMVLSGTQLLCVASIQSGVLSC